MRGLSRKTQKTCSLVEARLSSRELLSMKSKMKGRRKFWCLTVWLLQMARRHLNHSSVSKRCKQLKQKKTALALTLHYGTLL